MESAKLLLGPQRPLMPPASATWPDTVDSTDKNAAPGSVMKSAVLTWEAFCESEREIQ